MRSGPPETGNPNWEILFRIRKKALLFETFHFANILEK